VATPLTTAPLVSVITPAWQRHRLLLDQCIPSVQAQTYPNVEHIIVSDGPDPELADQFAARRFPPSVHFAELPEHCGIWGNEAKRWGIANLAKGSLIAYLDDDDAYRPNHVATLAPVFDDPSVGFAYSAVLMHGYPPPNNIAGDYPPRHAGISGSGIMHRRDILDVATWRDTGSPLIEAGRQDWDLVERWLEAGIGWAFCSDVTVDWCPQPGDRFLNWTDRSILGVLLASKAEAEVTEPDQGKQER
jgi:glycosyltransferase involved in cell wall biosynthesis